MQTRRELFLERMDGLIRGNGWEERIRAPVFSGAGSSIPRWAEGAGPTRCR